MNNPEAILSELTPDNAADWQHVGMIMQKLNQISGVSAQGHTWHDVVLDALSLHGHQMTSGHLHRIRRAYVFLNEGMRDKNIPIERLKIAKISSIDQAERLFQLDRDTGLDALVACLDIKRPATKAEIQKRYEDYLSAHPEKKSPMQTAWSKRRSNENISLLKIDADSSSKKQHPELSVSLHQIADRVSDLEATIQKDAEKIEELEQEILDINAELTITMQHLQITSEELTSERNENR